MRKACGSARENGAGGAEGAVLDRATRDRLGGLAQIAAVRKDAELAKLAALSARLATREQARVAIGDELARQIAVAVAEPDVPALGALDAHVTMSERLLDRLGAEIADIAAEREVQRQACAKAFGRAQVLDRLHLRARIGPKEVG